MCLTLQSFWISYLKQKLNQFLSFLTLYLFSLMKINIFSKQILNYLYILLVFTLFLLGVFFVHTRYGHLLWIQVTEIILTLLLETHFKSKS